MDELRDLLGRKTVVLSAGAVMGVVVAAFGLTLKYSVLKSIKELTK